MKPSLKFLLFTTLLMLLLPTLAISQDDTRESGVSAYIGTVFDNFVPTEQRKYLNSNLKDVAGNTDVRELFGFNADWRVLGDKTSDRQLWFYIETLHGVRSADVDCSTENGLPLDPANRDPKVPTLCYEGKDGDIIDLANAGAQARYILRNATSLEGFAGFRYELLKLQRGSSSGVSLYVKGQLGFMTISQGPGDFVDNHFFGLGLISTTGRFAGSFFDAGYGRTDLYDNKRLDRWKYDGYVTFSLAKEGRLAGVKPFAQITADTDFGGGADSVQSYLGFNFDLPLLFKW
jgi:hypothetical protein